MNDRLLRQVTVDAHGVDEKMIRRRSQLRDRFVMVFDTTDK